VSKGELTKQAILDHAAGVASQVGFTGLSIGKLAVELELSKSGLFAHFQSKEALQLQVLEHAAKRFVDVVVRPALAVPRGEPRVRAMFENWLAWPRESRLPGGCLFVAAAVELDDQSGPVRDRLVQLQSDWLDMLAATARSAIAEGHFHARVDPEQLAHELYGVMLAGHHAARLMRDPLAGKRTRTAFESLLAAARKPS
jgi:AcrR family transcriptional regulator